MKLEKSALSVIAPWKVFPGPAFGFKSPVVTTVVSLIADQDLDFQPFDTFFAERFGEPTANFGGNDEALELCFLARIISWSLRAQRRSRIAVSEGFSIRPIKTNPSQFQIVMSSVVSSATILSFDEMCNALLPMILKPTPEAELRSRLTEISDELELTLAAFVNQGQNRPYFIEIANSMGIPVFEVSSMAPIFGLGKHSIRLFSSSTPKTPASSFALAKDKFVTAKLLRKAGLPAATNIRVHDLDSVLAGSRALGFPVVLKPADKDSGEGVFASIQDEETLRWAFEKAKAVSQNLLLEKHFDGSGHRLTIANRELLSVTRKIPAGVYGDGESTIETLISEAQKVRDAERQGITAHQEPLSLDEEALGLLKQQGYVAEDIPEEGVFVALRRKNNAIAGGYTEGLRAEDVHPDNLAACIDAAEVLGLDIAGVDLLIGDISKSWIETGAVICEVNAQPQMGLSAAKRLFSQLFSNGWRIPVKVLFAERPETVSKVELAVIAKRLKCNAISTKKWIAINGRFSNRRYSHWFDAAQSVLIHRETESALLVLSLNEPFVTGWPTHQIDEAVIYRSPMDSSGFEKQLEKTIGFLKPYCDTISEL